MNEKFNELEARAQNRSQYLLAVLCDKTNRKTNEVTDAEKQELFNKTFLELILQECVDALDEADGSVHHSECLLKHFGVEA